MILVDAERVTMSRPERPLFTDASITVQTGDRLAIVGPNGSGKSTLARVLAGRTVPESGVVRRGRDVRVSFLDQTLALASGTVGELLRRDEQWRVDALADRLGVTPLYRTDVAALSGGEAKRVSLALALADDADLLVLDEPTNHLDIDAIAWLEEYLDGLGGGLVLITHDRFVLDRVTNRIVEIDRGLIYQYETGYSGYLEARATRAQQAAAAEATRQNLARRELAWLRRGAPARSTKQRARLARASALVEGGPAGELRDERLDLAAAGAAPRLGDLVVELQGVGHRFGATQVFSEFDLALDRRARLGFVGPNGAGKSTALDIIAGRLAPSDGEVVRGPTVRLAYYDQRSLALEPAATVRAVVAGDKGVIDWRDRRLMEQFWFDDDAQHASIGQLSGGEQRRLQLLLTLLQRPNLLLLDEPTNDLDLDTLRVLEDFLDEWPGALVVVSHDRAFIDRTCDDVIVFDAGRVPSRYPGGVAAWVHDHRRRRQPGAARSRTAPVAAAASVAAAPRAARRPSPSTLKHRLRAIEKALQPLVERRRALEQALGAQDHRRREEAATELAAVATEVATLEEQWLDVAAALEAIE